MNGLLEPGSPRAAGLTDDRAVLRAMLDVEVAWVRVQRRLGLVSDAVVAAVSDAAAADDHDVTLIAGESEGGGNPVIPMVDSLRERVRERSARRHDHSDAVVSATDAAAGPTRPRRSTAASRARTWSTPAVMLLVAGAGDALGHHLRGAADAAARLAVEHRDTVQVARTLGQPALPTTFGLKAAGWLGAIDDVVAELASVRAALPVQCGGAAGTMAAIETLAPGRSAEAAALLADELGLADLGRPWHTDRAPMTRVGDCLVRAADTMGKVATDIVTLSRAEIAELREPAVDGRGGSSTLPQKRNPVLSVLVRAVAIEAPHLGATLHSAAGLAVDERPDGAWHAEWGALLRLLRRVVVAAAQMEEVLAGLEVDAERMRRNVDAVGPALVGERLLREVARLPDGPSAVSALRPALVGGAHGEAPHAHPAGLPARARPVRRRHRRPARAHPLPRRRRRPRRPSRGPAPRRHRPAQHRPRHGPRGSVMTIPITLTQLRRPERPVGLLVVGPSLGTAVTPLWAACVSHLPGDLAVVGWDLPGHGASAAYDHPFTVQDLARAVVDATAGVRAEASGPVLYAGVSLGGAVGLALAIDGADAFDGAVIVASGAKIGEASGWYERADLVRRAGTPVMVEGSAQALVRARRGRARPHDRRGAARRRCRTPTAPATPGAARPSPPSTCGQTSTVRGYPSWRSPGSTTRPRLLRCPSSWPPPPAARSGSCLARPTSRPPSSLPPRRERSPTSSEVG